MNLYSSVSIANHTWQVIAINGDIATLLAEDLGEHIYNNVKPGNEYESSTIRGYLNSEILSELEANGIHPIPTTLSDTKCTDKVWLLSADETEKLPKDVLLKGHRCWWTRTESHCHPYGYSVVFIDGTVSYCNYDLASVCSKLTVRPAVQVRLGDLCK